MNQDEMKVLETIISCEISTYECWYAPRQAVVPTSNIAYLLGWSKYKVRKCLNALKAIGYIEYMSQGRPAIESNTENGYELICEPMPPINGYGLSKLGFESIYYKQAIGKWNKEITELTNSI